MTTTTNAFDVTLNAKCSLWDPSSIVVTKSQCLDTFNEAWELAMREMDADWPEAEISAESVDDDYETTELGSVTVKLADGGLVEYDVEHHGDDTDHGHNRFTATPKTMEAIARELIAGDPRCTYGLVTIVGLDCEPVLIALED